MGSFLVVSCLSVVFRVYKLSLHWKCSATTLSTLWANLPDKILVIFSYFSPNIGCDISCKLSPLETICMNCQSLFLRKKKYFKMSGEVISQHVKP